MPETKPILFELGKLYFSKEVLQLQKIKGIRIKDYLDRYQRGDWECKRPRDEHFRSLMLWNLGIQSPMEVIYEVLPSI